MDAPEDKDMYIHRVGRTARYTAGGRSLLCLLPSEYPAMSKLLSDAKLKIKKLSVNPNKAMSVSKRASAIVAANPDTNILAKKAFKSYLRSVHLMPNKEVFQVSGLPLDEFAQSLGLASTPSARFLKELKGRDEIRQLKGKNHKLQRLKEQIKAEKLKKRLEKYGDEKKKEIMAKMQKGDTADDDTADDTDGVGGLLLIKKKHTWKSSNDDDEQQLLPEVEMNAATNRPKKRIRIAAGSNGTNTRTTFDDDGAEEAGIIEMARSNSDAKFHSSDDLVDANEAYIDKVRERLEKTQEEDMAMEKDRVKERRHKKRMQMKSDGDDSGGDGDADGDGDGQPVLLGGRSDDGSQDEGSDSSGSSSSDDDIESDSDEDSSSSVPVADVQAQEDLALAMLRQRK